MASKKIVAKYAGWCGACGASFLAGSTILWEAGKKAVHVICPVKGPGALPVAAATPEAREPTPDVSGAPFVVYETWVPMRRAALDASLVSVIGETRRYALRPATRMVKAVPARQREVWADCSVCGAARDVCCVGGDPKAPGLGRCVVEPAQPAHEVLVSVADQRWDLPGLRAPFPEPKDPNDPTDEERAAIAAHEAALAAVEPGVYVVVGAGRWRFQSAEDNEDMGDMQGANWSGPLYLRRATAEEAEQDAARRWEAGRPERERVARERRERVLAEQAQAAWVAACAATVTPEMRAAFVAPAGMSAGYYEAHPEMVDVTLGNVGLSSHLAAYLTPEEQAERTATLTDVWQERRYDHGEWRATGSYLRAWTWRGQLVAERYTYVYDMEQAVRLAGCAELMAVVRERDAERRAREDAEHALRERVRAGDAPLICERFLAALTTHGTMGDPHAFGDAKLPLPADWAALRDEVVALGAAAFEAPAQPAQGDLATLLWSATGGRPGTTAGRHDASPRYVYGEWKKLVAAREKQAADRQARAEGDLGAEVTAEVKPRVRTPRRAARARRSA